MEIDDLISSGALEVVGVDESGEILYNFTEKLGDLYPELQSAVNSLFSMQMMQLWELNMVSMDVTEENPIVTLTDKAFDEELIKSLDEDLLHTLNEAKRTLLR
jgi:hypothetical protein